MTKSNGPTGPTLFDTGRTVELRHVLEVFDPGRVTQARQAKAWTKKRLADELGVSPAAVGQYEAGLIRPHVDQLVRLAGLLDVPPGFFSAGRPHADVDASQAHFKSLRSMRAYERDQALVFVDQLWELTQAIERFVHLPVVDLPSDGDSPSDHANHADQVDYAGGLGPASRALSAARALRDRWKLGDEPVAHLVRLLEAHGVIVGVLPFSDSGRVNAFSTSHTTRPVVVLTNDRNDVFAHRFSAAHELGHLALHHEALPGDARHEREADAFAAEFLMPGHRLAPMLPHRIDFTRLIKLQDIWGVSLEALLYRSRELGVISDASHRRARIKLHSLREQGLAPVRPVDEFGGEQPGLLQQAATVANIDIHELAARLVWPVDKVQIMLGQPRDQRPRLTLVGSDSDTLEPQ